VAVKSRQAIRIGRVTAAQALRIARRFGVILDLSNDIELAGHWKHGWIPLDAVAAAVKAKRYKGGDGREVRGKGRGGSVVESMRRSSVGRSKAGPPKSERVPLTAFEHRNDVFRRAGLPEQRSGESRASHAARVAAVRDERGKKAHAEFTERQKKADAWLLGSRQSALAGPRRAPHISAQQVAGGRHRLTDSRSGESVTAVHLASFHSQGHTITGVRGGLMHTRDDYGKRHSYDPATGRAAVTTPATRRAQQVVAQDRTRRLQNAQVAKDEARQLRNLTGLEGYRTNDLRKLHGMATVPEGTRAKIADELQRRGYVKTGSGWGRKSR